MPITAKRSYEVHYSLKTGEMKRHEVNANSKDEAIEKVLSDIDIADIDNIAMETLVVVPLGRPSGWKNHGI